MRYARITPYTAVGAPPASPWIIADDSVRGPGSRFLEEGGPGFVQHAGSTAYLDGVFEFNQELGNRVVRFSLLVDHEFADESEMFLFYTRLPKTCPGSGVLEFGTLGAGGGKTIYTNAIIESVQYVSSTVVSMKLRYVIRAGEPSGVS